MSAFSAARLAPFQLIGQAIEPRSPKCTIVSTRLRWSKKVVEHLKNFKDSPRSTDVASPSRSVSIAVRPLSHVKETNIGTNRFAQLAHLDEHVPVNLREL